MKNQIKYIIVGLILVFLITGENLAQVDPQISQPWMRKLVFNPAAIQKTEGLNIYGLAREQWTGFDKAPSGQVLGLSKYFERAHVGIGLSLINDKAGVSSFQNIKLNYSYDFNISKDLNLTFGAGMGIIHHQIDGSGLIYDDPSDPDAFQTNEQQTKADFDLGFELNYQNIRAGFSSLHLTKSNNKATNFDIPRHYFFYMNYSADLGGGFLLSPGFMARNSGKILHYGFSLVGGYGDLIMAGLDYRINDAMAIVTKLRITPEIQIGYSYDLDVGTVKTYSTGSHEISLITHISSGERTLKSPRFFD